MNEVIEHQCSNESIIQSILVEGMYKAVDYDQTGKITYVRKYNYFSFSRSNDLMRVRRRGYENNVLQGPEEMSEYKDLFYSPAPTVEVNHRQTALISLAERPQPYPLDFGYGLDYRDDLNKLVPRSSGWESSNKEGILTVRQDPANPSLILLEAHRNEVRCLTWIDPARGNLIVRRKIYEVLPDSLNQELVWDESEIIPKQFGKTWFFEKAWRETYQPYYETNGVPVLGKNYLQKEEIFTVTNFVAGASFKPDEFEFSTNNFPGLMVLQDKVGGKTIDLTTGGIIPTNAKTWQLHPRPPQAAASDAASSNRRKLVAAIGAVLSVLMLVVVVRLGRRK